jgi:gliding motility-associated-like protein
MPRRYLFLLLWVLVLPSGASAEPVEFIRNDGQWAGPFNYKASAGNGTIYLSPDAFTYVMASTKNRDWMDAAHHGWVKDSVQLKFHAYRMSFVGGSKTAMITGSKEQSWYYNYFLGKDQSRWKGGIHPYLALDYNSVYPGIDLHVASEEGMIKYEWLVAAGKDPGTVRMKIEGADGLSIKGGKLNIKTSVGDVQELKPVAYQYGNNGRQEVECRYQLDGNELTYSFPDGWDKSLPLVIDPTVVFCTLTGSTADNWGYTATYDGSGNFYAGGIMLSYQGGSFPTSTGAFQVSFGGGVADPNYQTSDAHGVGFASDIAIMKLNSTGTTRVWATYIGGSDNEQPHSLFVDGSNNLVIAGISYSSDYPVTTGCYDNSYNGNADIVVTKLNASGSALVGSTFVGGSVADGVNFNGSEYVFGNLKYNYGDNARSEVILDRNANVYITASTRSTNFPVTSNAYQGTKSGAQDAIFMKLNPTLTSLTYSTFLGGSSDDAGYVLALDTAQTNVYVAGGTMSTDFPATTGAWKNSYQGGSADGFIARFGNGGTYPLQKMTFMGTSGYDQVYGVQVDLENSVYAMGQTLGGTFPVTTGVYSNSGSSQFVIKMDSMLSTNVFSTVFGSGSSTKTNISPVAFLVDTCQNIYISGWGGDLDFTTAPGNAPASIGTTTGMPITSSLITAPLKSITDGFDFYFIVLSKNAANLLYGAFLGRHSTAPGNGEHVDGGTSRFDRQGIVYQGICANCGGSGSPSFPTTSGSWATVVGSTNCNEAAVKIAFQLSVPDAIATANPKAKGCPPLTVQFQNNSVNAITYSWNFRDGSPIDTTFAPTHIFQNPGTYQVQLVVFNPNACKVRDTAIITIIVDSNRIKSNYIYTVLDSCGPYRASFVNTSQYSASPGAVARTSFLWIFGDGTTYSGTTPPIHNFPVGGTYTVMLVMRDSLACNNPDTVRKVLTLDGLRVKALFQGPDSVCLKTPLQFMDQSTNATGITWHFGDGQTSTEAQPTHTYGAAAVYTVMLIAVNPNSCNKRDTLKKTVRIKKLPTADFTHAPIIPVSNTPIKFTNKSTNADYYTWTFGDGGNSSEVNPSHLYKKTGTFKVCLLARTAEGCADSLCKTVEADVRTAIDLPSAFSPNGDGSNDILFARGGAVETMNLKIYNRWGEKVFESNSLDKGWDGSYKGKPQEMDAYAYLLYATFIDGSSSQKQGNVTLIR